MATFLIQYYKEEYFFWEFSSVYRLYEWIVDCHMGRLSHRILVHYTNTLMALTSYSKFYFYIRWNVQKQNNFLLWITKLKIGTYHSIWIKLNILKYYKFR